MFGVHIKSHIFYHITLNLPNRFLFTSVKKFEALFYEKKFKNIIRQCVDTNLPFSFKLFSTMYFKEISEMNPFDATAKSCRSTCVISTYCALLCSSRHKIQRGGKRIIYTCVGHWILNKSFSHVKLE